MSNGDEETTVNNMYRSFCQQCNSVLFLSKYVPIYMDYLSSITFISVSTC